MASPDGSGGAAEGAGAATEAGKETGHRQRTDHSKSSKMKDVQFTSGIKSGKNMPTIIWTCQSGERYAIEACHHGQSLQSSGTSIQIHLQDMHTTINPEGFI